MVICQWFRTHICGAFRWHIPSHINPQQLKLFWQVAYQRILHLSYPDEFLNAMKTLFLKLFQPFLTSFVASLHLTNTSTVAVVNSTIRDFRNAFEGWDKVFDKLLAGFEERAGKVRQHCDKASSFLHYHISLQDRNSRLRSMQKPSLQKGSSSDSLETRESRFYVVLSELS